MFVNFSAQVLFWLCGSSIAWSSPTIPKLLNITTSPMGRALSIQEASWVSSLLTLGAVPGPFAAGLISKLFGKRIALISIGIPFLISYFVMAFSNTIEMFYFARLTCGLAVGGAFTTGLNYVVELANKNNKGALGSVCGITVSLGILFSYCLGPYVDVGTFNLVLAIATCAFVLIFPVMSMECPEHYVSRGNDEKARAIIKLKQGGYNMIMVFVEVRT